MTAFYYDFFAPLRMWSIVIRVSAWLSICLSDCFFVCLSTLVSQIPDFKIFPGPPLTAMRYVMYFQFCGWRRFHIMKWICPNKRRRVCFVQFTKWRHRGEVCRLRLHLVNFSYENTNTYTRNARLYISFNCAYAVCMFATKQSVRVYAQP